MPVKKRKKDLTLSEKLYIPEIVKGLGLTLKSMFRPKFTMEYPEVKFIPPASYRGRPVLVKEENETERCVACGLCARVCPALAIEVQASETPLEKERYPEKFEINMLRCIFCGFCEEVCPEEAIVMSKDYELVFRDRNDAIYGKDKLLVPVRQVEDRIDFLRNFK
ncbi:MAG: NADH-quinone oxidoreductase subunit NuoI [Bacteroidota bacterium]|jgi:NADH-quinone oxidoreductase subunit I|nr:NADH-quinone oxidoreductase subunit NuoI [Ignavibacteria bacterium]HEX2964069.1 NADH-quinone oxidoreductase subunit NuoI [Ignavibacteriales bacterium]MCU7498000.1 NADH-quinone oxidoreductase subunit NuoI [Ignavibacteria bacterium]MCU7511714.1 NADH-quinone oxidoreductase subunit NuoI [Ignavibacteria bacterium]MCU7519788.1 NADH-quinone oxidoreductase subunit NuoI [Ignavibacteria bacterium]